MWLSNRARVKNVAVMLALVTAATNAHAMYSCSGPVQNVEVGPSGVVTVLAPAAGLGPAYLCEIGTTINGVGPDACKAILSVLLTAHATGASVTFDYSDALTCTTHPTWDWLTGWYYGPEYD
jgi:hypothetical protein